MVLNLLDTMSTEPLLVIVVEQAFDQILSFRSHHPLFSPDTGPLDLQLKDIVDNILNRRCSERPLAHQ